MKFSNAMLDNNKTEGPRMYKICDHNKMMSPKKLRGQDIPMRPANTDETKLSIFCIVSRLRFILLDV